MLNCESTLPSLSSIRKVKWPFFHSTLFPRSTILDMERNARHTAPSLTIPSGQEEIVKAKVAIIPISEWARFDLSNIAVLKSIRKSQTNQLYQGASFTTQRCIERSPLLSHANEVASSSDNLYVSSDTGEYQARRGDIISVRCIRGSPNSTPSGFNLLDSFGDSIEFSGYVSFTFCPGACGSTLPLNHSFFLTTRLFQTLPFQTWKKQS